MCFTNSKKKYKHHKTPILCKKVRQFNLVMASLIRTCYYSKPTIFEAPVYSSGSPHTTRNALQRYKYPMQSLTCRFLLCSLYLIAVYIRWKSASDDGIGEHVRSGPTSSGAERQSRFPTGCRRLHKWE